MTESNKTETRKPAKLYKATQFDCFFKNLVLDINKMYLNVPLVKQTPARASSVKRSDVWINLI